jgi:thiamine-phosphate diphosphorylase
VKRYCITDSLEAAARASAAGVDMIQIRAKELTTRDLMRLVRGAVSLAACPVLVNGRLDVALACQAQGVHLPSHSIAPCRLRSITPAGFLVGVSCHTLDELRAAEDEGADFAVFGPIFQTSSKPGTVPHGLEALRAAVRSVQLPVYALGGITQENAALCIAAGASGVAGISLFRG